MNHRVAIVGGGFAGLFAAKRLARVSGVEVTLIDRTNHHLFQPLLYKVATGILSEGSVAPTLRDILGLPIPQSRYARGSAARSKATASG